MATPTATKAATETAVQGTPGRREDGRSPRVIVFDFDGTLVDSLDVWDKVGVDWVARHKLPAWPTMQKEMAVLTLSAAAELTVQHYNLQTVCSALMCCCAAPWTLTVLCSNINTDHRRASGKGLAGDAAGVAC